MLARSASVHRGLDKEGSAQMSMLTLDEERKKEEILLESLREVHVRNKWQDKAQWTNETALAYLSVSDKFFELAYGEYAQKFDAFIIVIIISAGLLVGLQTYPEFSCPVQLSVVDDDRILEECKERWGGVHDTSSLWLGTGGIVDQIITWIFVSEVIIKVLASGLAPWNYWVGADWRWNNFDFAIVLLSFEQVAAVIFSGGSSTIRVLRLFRLARLLKLVGKIPKLQAIVSGLMAGVSSVKYIALLLFLVFYIFAVAGITFFGINDPFHFRTVPIALMTLFRAATLEDWTDIMYINFYGCDRFSSGLYYVEDKYYNKKTETDVPGAFDDDPFFSTWSEVPAHFQCKQPIPSPWTSSGYWVSFVLINSMVMLSLFVGSVTIAMSESMAEAKKRAELIKQAQEHHDEDMEDLKAKAGKGGVQDNEEIQNMFEWLAEKFTCGKVHLFHHRRESPPDQVMRDLIIQALDLSQVNPALVEALKALEDKDDEATRKKKRSLRKKFSQSFREMSRGEMTIADGQARMARKVNKSFRQVYEAAVAPPKYHDRNIYKYGALSRCAIMCRDTAVSPLFSNFVTLCIILAGVSVGMNSEYEHADVDPHAKRKGMAAAYIGSIIWYSNTVINWVFTAEMVLKIIGEDWHVWTYFYSHWNKFDFFIVVSSWIPYFLDASELNSLKLLRLLRLFRILRLIKFLPKLAVIVDSIIHGFESITFIAIIMAVVYYMFAILGMMLFAKNDPFHFGYLHRAMLTLFRICTFDDWTDVMYINVYGCSQWGYSDDSNKPNYKTCNETYYTKEVKWNWAAAFYFILFSVLGALVLLTLFIGVVTTSMEEAYNVSEKKTESFQQMVEHASSRGINLMACRAFLSAFNRIDEDQSGNASVHELIEGLKSVGFTATAHDLRATLKTSPFTTKDSDAELSPFDFFLFLIDMAENRPSFFFGGEEPDSPLSPRSPSSVTPSPQLDPTPISLRYDSPPSSPLPIQQVDESKPTPNIAVRKENQEEKIDYQQPPPRARRVVRDSAAIARLKQERDDLLRSTMDLKRQIREETTRRASASVDRPPPPNTSRSRNRNMSPSRLPLKLVTADGTPMGSVL